MLSTSSGGQPRSTGEVAHDIAHRGSGAGGYCRQRAFDNLTANIDRNQGNLLYDAEYHVVLIDHSRAFVDTQDMTKFQKYLFVDRPLWERMQALTLESVQPALGKWVSKGMLLAMLERRHRMGKEIGRMVAARGDNTWLQ